jgi:hypothetical protein
MHVERMHLDKGIDWFNAQYHRVIDFALFFC